MRSLLLVMAASLAAACSESAAERSRILTNARDLSVCCDGTEAVPIEVGDFQVQIFQAPLADLDPDTVQGTFTSVLTNRTEIAPGQHSRPDPVRLSLASGGGLSIGSNTIEIWIDDCRFDRVDVDFVAEVTGRRLTDRTLAVIGLTGSFAVVNTCPPTGGGDSPPQRITETILGAPIADFERFVIATPTGVPTRHPSSQVESIVPPLAFTETFEVGSLVVELDAQQLAAAFTGPSAAFPTGPGDRGLTLAGFFSLPMQPGEYLLAWQCVTEDIPLDDPVRTLQFALAVDRDGDPSNNFEPNPPFDQDPFQDTDTWFSATYDRISGWNAFIADAAQRPPFELDTAVRIILQGQVQYFVIPVSELGSPTEITGRFSTFAHEGDFGLSEGPWSADVTPPIDEPMLPISLQPSPL